MYLKPLIKGLLTYVPKVDKLTRRKTGGTNSARYCYSVWLRHLVMAHQGGLSTLPRVIIELGPGDSIGTGLAALLSGADKYYALDAKRYGSAQMNLDILEELVALFTSRTSIPDHTEFPRIKPPLQSYEFPHHILADNHLQHTLNSERIHSIRTALTDPAHANKSNIEIQYFAPWCNINVIEWESVNMIFSQAVLQYIEDLTVAYDVLSHWIKPGGFMSHEIVFSSLGSARDWNGHWAYTDFMWKLVKGKRPFFFNREPHSTHISLLKDTGFEVVMDKTVVDTSGITRKNLSPRFSNMSEQDLTTRNAYILARKK